jgi:hypothetical protein
MTFPSQFLRYVLLADAILSGATGLLQVLFSGWLGALLELPVALLLWTGVVLVIYAAAVAYLAFHENLSRPMVWTVVAVNLLWAVDCVAILALGWVDPNMLGTGWILMQVAVVVIFAELQYIALRRSAVTAVA